MEGPSSGESAVGAGTSRCGEGGLDALPAVGELPPEFAVILHEELNRLLAKLDDAALQHVAIAKMEGYTNAEIAQKWAVSLETIERRLKLIRRIWRDQEP